MRNITYREIQNALAAMTPEQLDMNASVFVSDTDEYYPIKVITVTKETDVLDANHPFFLV